MLLWRMPTPSSYQFGKDLAKTVQEAMEIPLELFLFD